MKNVIIRTFQDPSVNKRSGPFNLFLPGAKGKPKYMLIETTDNEESGGGGEDFSLGPSEDCPKGVAYQDSTPCQKKEATCTKDPGDKECPQIKFKCQVLTKPGDLHDGKVIWYMTNREEMHNVGNDCI